MRTLAEDTDPRVEQVLIELWRQATPARKLSLMFDTTRALQAVALAGLREQHPHDPPARLRRRFADVWLGPDLAQRVYGAWLDDPKRS